MYDILHGPAISSMTDFYDIFHIKTKIEMITGMPQIPQGHLIWCQKFLIIGSSLQILQDWSPMHCYHGYWQIMTFKINT